MPLSIFIDALPFNEVKDNYKDFIENKQIAELIPNIAYSSSLHWQLYCDKYPDDRGVLVDWVKEDEKRKSVKLLSVLLSPTEHLGIFGILTKKFLDRIIYKRNTFANIPFRFRKFFTQKGEYLFWKKATYSKQEIFDGYTVISQDEGHKTFEETINFLKCAVERKERKIFAVFGFADSIGHKCRRGELYSQKLKLCMKQVEKLVYEYIMIFPNEEVLIVSDHGMSTVKQKIDLKLEENFGKQSRRAYIAYCDTAVMCIWTKEKELEEKIKSYLSGRNEGHLLTDKEREYFGATDKKFGDIIYILKEGNVFKNNWFGKSVKRPNSDGSGMHGFWPERSAEDQMACIILHSAKRKLDEFYDYRKAHSLIYDVMKEDNYK